MSATICWSDELQAWWRAATVLHRSIIKRKKWNAVNIFYVAFHHRHCSCGFNRFKVHLRISLSRCVFTVNTLAGDAVIRTSDVDFQWGAEIMTSEHLDKKKWSRKIFFFRRYRTCQTVEHRQCYTKDHTDKWSCGTCCLAASVQGCGCWVDCSVVPAELKEESESPSTTVVLCFAFTEIYSQCLNKTEPEMICFSFQQFRLQLCQALSL